MNNKILNQELENYEAEILILAEELKDKAKNLDIVIFILI